MINNKNEVISEDIFDCTKERVQDFFEIEKKLNHFKNTVEKLIAHGKISENNIYHIDTLREFIYIFNNLVIKGTQIVTVYNEHSPLFLNPVFCKLKGLSYKEIYSRLGEGENMLRISYEGLNETIFKARKYISKLLSNEIVGYRNAEFKMPAKNEKGEDEIISILWNTIMLQNGINIRIGFDVKDNISYFKEELLEKIELGHILTFSKKIDRLFKKLNISNIENQELIKNIRLMALIVDFYVHFGSMPVAIYRGNEPRLLNKSFIELTGYTEEEIMEYYRQFGSVTRLFYKGEDYLEVMEYINYLKENGYTGNGYEDIDFTITSKVDENGEYKRIKIGWNTFIVGDLSVRSGIVKDIKEMKLS